VTEASPAETGTIETGPNDTSPREASAARTGRKTRQRPGQDRRQALVEAAYRRIAECGFEGLRLRDVAAEVAISRSRLLRTTARAFFRLCGAVGPLRRAVFGD
jgi:hypothetical protein